MESIFHERQEGSLCAQHCLNSLLQSDYYSADVLSDLAKDLDRSEHMLDLANDKPSNCDDSGFFSIQVLQQALTVWNIELRPITSPDAVCAMARADPRTQKAFICNFREHWFTIRLLGSQWFNLNSLLSGPELLSDTYLSLFLKQLQQEGYSIFVVIGDLPSCEADYLLKLNPAVQHVKPGLLTEYTGSRPRGGQDDDWDDADEDINFKKALEESRRLLDVDDASLKQALKLSMTEMEVSPSPSRIADLPAPNPDEVRQRRLAHFANLPGAGIGGSSTAACNASQVSKVSQEAATVDELSEEQQLAAAIKLSMANST